MVARLNLANVTTYPFDDPCCLMTRNKRQGRTQRASDGLQIGVTKARGPNPHNYIDVPVILGGRGGGFVSTGRHVRAGTPGARADTGEMWLGVLQGLTVPVTSFGQLKVTKPLAAIRG